MPLVGLGTVDKGVFTADLDVHSADGADKGFLKHDAFVRGTEHGHGIN